MSKKVKPGNKSLLMVDLKNRHQNVLYRMKLSHIQRNERRFEMKSDRELTNARDQFMEMQAYAYVYKKHNLEDFTSAKDLEPHIESEDDIGHQPDTLVNSLERVKGEWKHSTDAKNHISSNKWLYERSANNKVETTYNNFSNVCDAHYNRVPSPGIAQFPYALPPHNQTSMKDKTGNDFSLNTTEPLPAIATGSGDYSTTKRLEANAAQATNHLNKLFPGDCRSACSFRRFIRTEVNNVLVKWSPENRRKNKVKKIISQVSLPPFIERTKTTSAILRDFNKYKHKRDERKSMVANE